jgi:hypothetical protein
MQLIPYLFRIASLYYIIDEMPYIVSVYFEIIGVFDILFNLVSSSIVFENNFENIYIRLITVLR